MAGFIDSLVKNSNDKLEIKTQVDLGGESFQIFKFFRENISPQEVVTIVEEKVLSSGVFILGNSSFGILGTSPLGAEDELVVVWGNPTYGVWGTSNWGEESSVFIVVRVIPYNDVYIERFNSSQLIETLTDCNITGKVLTFTADGEMISKCIYKNDINVVSANINVLFTNEVAGYELYLSNNGTDWESTTINTLHTFTTTGQELYYKVIGPNGTIINQINVSVNK